MCFPQGQSAAYFHSGTCEKPTFLSLRKEEKKQPSSLSQGSGEQLKCKAFQQFLLLNELAWTLRERRPCVVFTLKDNQKKNATEDFFFF